MSQSTSSDLILSRRSFLQAASVTAISAAAISTQTEASPEATTVTENPLQEEPINPDFNLASAVTNTEASVATIVLNRMGFGPRPGDREAFNALGANDEARIAAYVEQQLNPDPAQDTEVAQRFIEAGFQTLDKTMNQLWRDHYRNDPGGDWTWTTLPIRETERATFIRAIYSKWQLQEVMADFWHNHFNVNGWESPQRHFFVQYDRDVIRQHLFGNFRDMLEAVAKSPVMLYYLDNESNTRSGPNENWARELFEIHGLGALNYYGVQSQSGLPSHEDNSNVPVGYVDGDVYEATRCFTGWTVSNSTSRGDTGEFMYIDDNHDRFQKSVLAFGAINFPADQGPMVDGLQVLDLIANHPGTAYYMCRKICKRLVNDEPSQTLINSAAAIFQQHVNSPDQIKRVLRHILNSAEFRTGLGNKIKRPFEATVSAMRLGQGDWLFGLDDDTSRFFTNYNRMGQQLFTWPAPDGYPDDKEAWSSSTPMIMRWRMYNYLTAETDENGAYRMPVFESSSAIGSTAPKDVLDYWISQILDRAFTDDEYYLLISFVAQPGNSPTQELPLLLDEEYHRRLRSLVSLLFQTPYFNMR